MHNDDKLDQIVDAALTSYIDEPRPGLEHRVLASVRAESLERRVRWLQWAAAAGAAACVLVAVLMLTHTRPTTTNVAHVAPTPVASVATPQPKAPASALPARRVAHKRPAAKHPEPLPKLREFPSPSPLSDEERTLLAVVRRPEPETLQALAQAQQRNAEPLRIADIQIEEIQIDPLPSGGK